MKKLFKKDIKGIRMTDEINRVIDMVNAEKINTYNMQGGSHFDAIMKISFYLLKNGKFEESIYFDGNPFDFRRISWYLSDMFNATVGDTQRMLRTMDLTFVNRIYMSERFGLNHFEIIR